MAPRSSLRPSPPRPPPSPPPPPPPARQRRILFISLEFSAASFSGNGVYARSQVRALAAAGHAVMVLSARPAAHDGRPAREGARTLEEVAVGSWGRLDAGGPWAEFAAGAAAPALAARVAEFAPQVALVVDWSGFAAYEALCCALAAGGVGGVGGGGGGAASAQPAPLAPPLVFLNYRVFSRTAEEGEGGEAVRCLERRAVAAAALTVALSRSDAAFIAQHLAAPCEGAAASVLPPPPPPAVLLPPLRADVRALPPPRDLGDPGDYQPPAERPYLTCCVRLSPEKAPDRRARAACRAARSAAAAAALQPPQYMRLTSSLFRPPRPGSSSCAPSCSGATSSSASGCARCWSARPWIPTLRASSTGCARSAPTRAWRSASWGRRRWRSCWRRRG